MHELAVCQSLIEQIREIAAREDGEKVKRVSVSVGALSGVEREALEFAFPVAAEGTMAEGARLEVDEVPASGHCRECGSDAEIVFPFAECSACHSVDIEIAQGRDFILKSLEIC